MGLSLLKDIISSKQSRSKKPHVKNLYHNHSSIMAYGENLGVKGGEGGDQGESERKRETAGL